jgi:hypothetical protein
MSTLSQDPTTWRRNRSLQHDGARQFRRQQGLQRSHTRPVEQVYPPLVPADTPDFGNKHEEPAA